MLGMALSTFDILVLRARIRTWRGNLDSSTCQCFVCRYSYPSVVLLNKILSDDLEFRITAVEGNC